jgi:hypothetical protein
VLFDTIRKTKDEGLGFFILAVIIMTGFTISANIWFGSQSIEYSTI